jgi:excinuclease UvrABC nuclease subunit
MLSYGWSVNRDEWNAVQSEVFEASWPHVKFNNDSSELIPKQRGIYMIVLDADNVIPHKPFDSFSSPLYVGHSTNLNQRFKNHTVGRTDNNIRRKMSKFTNCMHFYYAVFKDHPKDSLRILEQSLIDVFGPPLNSINSISSGVKTEQVIQANTKEQPI